MKKIRLILIVLFITLSIFVVSGCYYKDKSKTVIVNEIKVFDAYWTELKTEELHNNDVEWYFNTFNNGLKPINSPAPIVRYAGFTINTEDFLIVKVYCTAKNNTSLTFSMEEYHPDSYAYGKKYEPTHVEQEGQDFIITFEIDEVPVKNMFYRFTNVKVTDSTGKTTYASLDYPSSNSTGYYGGLVAKVNELYLPYRTILSDLNNNISTELKLLQDVSQIAKDIKDEKEQTYAKPQNYYYYFYNKIKYPSHNPEDGNEFSFLSYKIEMYSLSYGFYADKNYVYEIRSSDPNTSIFGITINNTIEEVENTLTSNNYTKQNSVNNYNYQVHVYQSELDFIQIIFYYSIQNEKYVGFSVVYNHVFNY